MGLTTYGNYEIEDQVNFTVYVPKVEEHFIGSLTVIPLQLLGYYVSVAKGLDVDKPRNLAKSVTVEQLFHGYNNIYGKENVTSRTQVPFYIGKRVP